MFSSDDMPAPHKKPEYQDAYKLMREAYRSDFTGLQHMKTGERIQYKINAIYSCLLVLEHAEIDVRQEFLTLYSDDILTFLTTQSIQRHHTGQDIYYCEILKKQAYIKWLEIINMSGNIMESYPSVFRNPTVIKALLTNIIPEIEAHPDFIKLVPAQIRAMAVKQALQKKMLRLASQSEEELIASLQSEMDKIRTADPGNEHFLNAITSECDVLFFRAIIYQQFKLALFLSENASISANNWKMRIHKIVLDPKISQDVVMPFILFFIMAYGQEADNFGPFLDNLNQYLHALKETISEIEYGQIERAIIATLEQIFTDKELPIFVSKFLINHKAQEESLISYMWNMRIFSGPTLQAGTQANPVNNVHQEPAMEMGSLPPTPMSS